MSDITLTHAVRQNLLSLQNTSMLMARTQDRLSTGNKVNSALDNPNSFFTAASLNDRASDLSNLLDAMGQAVQTLKAADEGIMAITKLAEAAKAKANQALQTTIVSERAKFAAEYNALMTQIEGLAQDSGYNGKNLLTGAANNLTVIFNEYNTNTLSISAIDYTDTSLANGLNVADIGPISSSSLVNGTFSLAAKANASVSGTDFITHNTNGLTNVANGETLSFTDGTTTVTLAVTGTTTYTQLKDKMEELTGVTAAFNDGADTVDITSTAANITVSSTGALAAASTNYAAAVSASGMFESDAQIEAAISEINASLRSLRTQASTFGTNLTVVNNRERFTREMMITLEIGAGMLTLADTNEEGANLLALQTRQQLSTTALSMAAQADQNVLRLFG